MSIYMELCCEPRGELPINESKCWSEVDRSLWAMALIPHESTEQTTTELFSMATMSVGKVLMVIGYALAAKKIWH